MIPILHAPGVMIPGQFGPISRVLFPRICAFTRIMSITGIPSVMQTTRSRSASTASRIESAANAAGTKIIETLQSVFCFASQTVSNTGIFSSNIRPVIDALPRVKRTGTAGDSLNQQPRVFINQDGHKEIRNAGVQEKETEH